MSSIVLTHTCQPIRELDHGTGLYSLWYKLHGFVLSVICGVFLTLLSQLHSFLLLFFPGWKSHLQKRRHDCGQPQIRRKMMELSLERSTPDPTMVLKANLPQNCYVFPSCFFIYRSPSVFLLTPPDLYTFVLFDMYNMHLSVYTFKLLKNDEMKAVVFSCCRTGMGG